MSIPRTPVNQGKKSFKRWALGKIADQAEELIILKRDMRKIIGEEVEKYTKSYMSRVEHIIKEYEIWRAALIKKGILTRDEINEELRK